MSRLPDCGSLNYIWTPKNKPTSMSNTDVSNSPSNDSEPGTSQSHEERPISKPTGLKLVLPPLKAGKRVKGIRRSNVAGPSFIVQETEIRKPIRPVKLKPLKEVLTRLINQIKK